MKRSLSLVLAILALAVASICVSAAPLPKGYTPNTKIEQEYIDGGYEVLSWNDAVVDQRQVYYLDNTCGDNVVYKRWVRFGKVDVKGDKVLPEELAKTGLKVTESIRREVDVVYYWVKAVKQEMTPVDTVKIVPVKLDFKTLESKEPIAIELENL